MTDYAPFPLIDLSGSPRERGRMHGKAAADRLRRGARMYAESLLKSGVDWPELERRAEALVPSIEKFDPAYIEEMRGIAEGANEPFAAVVLMNARTEMVAAARQEQEARTLARCRTAAPRRSPCPKPAPTACCCTARTGTGAPSAPRPACCCASIATTGPTS